MKSINHGYTMDSALAKIYHAGLDWDRVTKIIMVDKTIGIHTMGALDFLREKCGMKIIYS